MEEASQSMALVVLCSILLLAGIVVILGTVFLIRKNLSAIDAPVRAWRQLAAKTKLTFDPTSTWATPLLVGTHRERAVSITTIPSETQAAGAAVDTDITLPISNPANAYFGLSEQAAFNERVGAILGIRPVKIGDEKFDERFMLRCQPDDFGPKLFTAVDIRQALLKLHPFREIRLDKENLVLEHEGPATVNSPDDVLSMLDLLVDLATRTEQMTK